MLVGREAEQVQLRRLLDDASRGRSGVLVLRGEAGAGKTWLLDDLIAGADNVLVLRAHGVETESELPYAGLHQLLRPVANELDGLAPPQADALRAAFGLRAAAPTNGSWCRWRRSICLPSSPNDDPRCACSTTPTGSTAGRSTHWPSSPDGWRPSGSPWSSPCATPPPTTSPWTTCPRCGSASSTPTPRGGSSNATVASRSIPTLPFGWSAPPAGTLSRSPSSPAG